MGPKKQKLHASSRFRNNIISTIGPFDSEFAAAIAHDIDYLKTNRPFALYSYHLYNIYRHCLATSNPSIEAMTFIPNAVTAPIHITSTPAAPAFSSAAPALPPAALSSNPNHYHTNIFTEFISTSNNNIP